MRILVPLLLAVALSGPALAQDSAADASGASQAGSQAAALLGRSGVKAAVGVSAAPASVAAVGLSTAGAASAAAGHVSVAAGGEFSQAAGGSANVALKVDDDIVVSPDPAPKVPYQAQPK